MENNPYSEEESNSGLLNDPRVIRFLYQTGLIISGMIVLLILSDDGFPVGKTILVMLAWFVLIIIFPVPEAAKTDIEPFAEDFI
jgi:hypothetical protein